MICVCEKFDSIEGYLLCTTRHKIQKQALWASASSWCKSQTETKKRCREFDKREREPKRTNCRRANGLPKELLLLHGRDVKEKFILIETLERRDHMFLKEKLFALSTLAKCFLVLTFERLKKKLKIVSIFYLAASAANLAGIDAATSALIAWHTSTVSTEAWFGLWCVVWWQVAWSAESALTLELIGSGRWLWISNGEWSAI